MPEKLSGYPEKTWLNLTYEFFLWAAFGYIPQQYLGTGQVGSLYWKPLKLF